MFKQFWLFTANSQPHLILQECAVIMSINCCNNWHRMVKHESISAEEHNKHDFQSNLSGPYNFLPRSFFGMPFSIALVQLSVK